MTRKIQGTVAVTSADNLASQLLGGYMQLGSATRRCRHCMAHRVDMGTKVCLHNNMVKVLPCSVTRPDNFDTTNKYRELLLKTYLLMYSCICLYAYPDVKDKPSELSLRSSDHKLGQGGEENLLTYYVHR